MRLNKFYISNYSGDMTVYVNENTTLRKLYDKYKWCDTKVKKGIVWCLVEIVKTKLIITIISHQIMKWKCQRKIYEKNIFKKSIILKSVDQQDLNYYTYLCKSLKEAKQINKDLKITKIICIVHIVILMQLQYGTLVCILILCWIHMLNWKILDKSINELIKDLLCKNKIFSDRLSICNFTKKIMKGLTPRRNNNTEREFCYGTPAHYVNRMMMLYSLIG